MFKQFSNNQKSVEQFNNIATLLKLFKNIDRIFKRLTVFGTLGRNPWTRIPPITELLCVHDRTQLPNKRIRFYYPTGIRTRDLGVAGPYACNTA